MNNIFEVKDFKVNINDKEIVKGIDITLEKGEVAVIMGPNGSGKSTFAQALMGHPSYNTTGNIILDDKELNEMNPEERSKNGLFLSFQYPTEIPGVSIANFLRMAVNSRREKKDQINIIKFTRQLHEKMDMLHIPKNFSTRYVNEGFSGGEKKKMEILQMAMLNPKVAILDETDSGLDIDALKKVCESINILKEQDKDLTVLIITHYQRMLNYITPDHVMIMLDGKIVKKAGPELVHDLEKNGYEEYKK